MKPQKTSKTAIHEKKKEKKTILLFYILQERDGDIKCFKNAMKSK